jgi:hypothetical protein
VVGAVVEGGVGHVARPCSCSLKISFSFPNQHVPAAPSPRDPRELLLLQLRNPPSEGYMARSTNLSSCVVTSKSSGGVCKSETTSSGSKHIAKKGCHKKSTLCRFHCQKSLTGAL